MEPRGWRAWYVEGLRLIRLFEGVGLEEWAALPREGMLAAALILPSPYRRIIKGGDHYWLDASGRLRRTRTHPVWGRWSPPPRGVPREHVKRAGVLPDEQWESFIERLEARTA